ncbi:MAG: hypothetical protein KUA43_04685 [Hoeflea sp.]|uniref:hypothetical protein n=1 Tax=Hoeflea sp. TaxID=1940281 RepID=UPI001DC93124|nr:hypothetical protein [Hoeflea sp.]MBU4531995.1 hypothetical protein [Alphaproteobacteria bacterium]MBU4546417.1 hypothetical protein [Alphaproteobacteria bacterium]MBU4549546.1 hypothetical protein [Alphaproteobacteria bacterium]MBV1722721.1 hypothetical protein [Hoeflea sp.]MBV1782660.1 hypothetical protein [Hoeflea sp.]
MTGASLSKWTLSYFAAALLSLLVAEALMAAGYGYPADGLRAPSTLAVVHLSAVGWLSLLMCGALFQFVPVLVNRPLAWAGLMLPALVFIVLGLVSLVSGFMAMDGLLETAAPLLPMGGLLLSAGFAMAVASIGLTLVRSRPLPIPSAFVATGLAGLIVAVALGLVFTQVLGGTLSAPVFAPIAAWGVPIHAAAGLGGWLAMCAVGVSYRLFPMFLLAPDPQGTGTRLAFLFAAAAVATAIVGGLAALFSGWPVPDVMRLAAVAAVGATVFYGRDVINFYRARRRRDLELNMKVAAIAFVSLAFAVLLPGALVALGRSETAVAACIYMAAFGWLSGLGLAKLYKIVPFMTWLECYGPVLGRAPTPRVQDLVREARAGPWFLLYFVSVWAGTVAMALGSATGFRIAAAGTFAATAAIAVYLVRARMLSDVDGSRRFPAGSLRPSLLYSLAPDGR